MEAATPFKAKLPVPTFMAMAVAPVVLPMVMVVATALVARLTVVAVLPTVMVPAPVVSRVKVPVLA